MRHARFAAASAVLLVCLGACGNDSDADIDTASGDAVMVEPTASASPTALDPYAWTDVPYADYLEAADQIGLRPDVLVAEAGFSSGLSVLCRTSAEELATMRSSYVEDVTDSGTYSTAKYLADEVGLRLGLACPQRMTDWTAASVGQDDTDIDSSDEGSSVTDDDLDRATAEEAAKSSAPSGPADADDADDADEADDADADYGDNFGDDSNNGESSSETDETSDTGGTTAGNSDRQT